MYCSKISNKKFAGNVYDSHFDKHIKLNITVCGKYNVSESFPPGTAINQDKNTTIELDKPLNDTRQFK